MLMLKLMDILYLDGYKSLWDKYHDPDRDLFREQRHAAYNNYRYYYNLAFRNMDFKTMFRMRRAKKRGDYLELFEIEMQIENTYGED